ncbi:MAG: AAA family ATPase [Pseudomonadota bacterium]|nr:AAA family ATPase [Pseudomonadota bacterium]
MRLTKIKLSGFKTFVDPTTLTFPSNLTGVIGPNGCGKSNIIDAVKWVMGESSARSLRGDSMEAVIFSGSSSREPVGKANVELFFDNSNNTLDLKFAKYNEIVIRRELTRDGVSNYYLNSTRCRRKDIREVFLGTGLGPRSYAIIEQGMISRLVESKPEELRTYLEEAAGISKYKEKRRETELRLKHTKENLSRLKDVMKEINSQLGKLERQATAAENYKDHKSKERQLKLDIIALKWLGYDLEINEIEKEISKETTNQEKFKADLTSKDELIEKEREKRSSEEENANKIQSEFYQIGSEIAKCESDIEHTQETETSRKLSLDEIESSFNEIEKLQVKDQEKADQLNTNINEENEKLVNIKNKIKDLSSKKSESAFALQNWQTIYNEFLSNQAETIKEDEIEKTKIASYQKSVESLAKRLKILESDSQIDKNSEQVSKNTILNDATGIKEKLSAVLIDFERIKLPKDDENKTLSQIPKAIINIAEKFKNLFNQIKLLVRSQQDEITDIKNKIDDYDKLLKKSNQKLDDLQKQIKEDETNKNKLEKEKIDLKQMTDKIIWEFDETLASENELNVSISKLSAEQSSIKDNLSRYVEEKKSIESKKQKITTNVSIPESMPAEMQSKLTDLLRKKQEKEDKLSTARDQVAKCDQNIQQFELDKQKINVDINKIGEILEAKRISLGERNAQKISLKDNIEVNKDEIDLAIKEVDRNINASDLENDLEKLKTKIDNLGPINLAAIDELQEQEERKKYLDNQYDDLSKSISTLESAIKKIDTDTKSKFKDVFDQINKNLEYLFPKIFGGGKAYLEMTDNDLLNTGITIMAKPPGKLVRNISLLSGGEKAGTGVSFVFSMFKLNPAPFCFLDEVDAPLDEGNNVRFCSIVKEMSEEVQIIFITHNKPTMEIADVLSGVTMREPGVSKLVSVNIKEAMELNENQNIAQTSTN